MMVGFIFRSSMWVGRRRAPRAGRRRRTERAASVRRARRARPPLAAAASANADWAARSSPTSPAGKSRVGGGCAAGTSAPTMARCRAPVRARPARRRRRCGRAGRTTDGRRARARRGRVGTSPWHPRAPPPAARRPWQRGSAPGRPSRAAVPQAPEDGQRRGGADLLADDVQRQLGEGVPAGGLLEHAPEERVRRPVAERPGEPVHRRAGRARHTPPGVADRIDGGHARRHARVNFAIGSPTSTM